MYSHQTRYIAMSEYTITYSGDSPGNQDPYNITLRRYKQIEAPDERTPPPDDPYLVVSGGRETLDEMEQERL